MDLGHLIAGRPIAGAGGRSGDVFDPSAGKVTQREALASRAEIDAALAAGVVRG